MGPALTTGWCRVINGLHREINCSAAISSTRKTQPLRFKLFNECVVTVINVCFPLLVSISCIDKDTGLYNLRAKGSGCVGKKWNCSLPWEQYAASQHSLSPVCPCALSSFYSLFSDTLHFSVLWTFISYKTSKHIWFYLYTTDTHSVSLSLFLGSSTAQIAFREPGVWMVIRLHIDIKSRGILWLPLLLR